MAGVARVTVANSRFYHAAPLGAAQQLWVSGSGAKVVVFGSLFDGNRDRYWGTGGQTIVQAQNAQSEGLVLANCTFVDNGPRPAHTSDPYITAWSGVSGNTNMTLLMINCLVGVTNAAATVDRHLLYSYRVSDTQFGHFLLQNCTFSEDNEPDDTNMWFRASTTYMNDLADALSTLVGGRYRFHALDSSGNLVPNPGSGANWEETIAFVTKDDLSGETPMTRTYKYSLLAESPSSFSGAFKNMGTYQYVDIDHDGVFDADLDIVVGGSAPPGAKYVYKYDLRMLGRVTKSGTTPNSTYSFEPKSVLATGRTPSEMGYAPCRGFASGIDRGAYQNIPPLGSVVIIR
ncbi:MAG: hypothetical protein ACUVWX_04375 [Kiritimatiellia bacterium]